MRNNKVFVLGASNVDIIGFPDEKLIMQDANIGKMKISAGGVGRNIAHNLKLLGFDVQLASIFGSDPLSHFLIDNCSENRLDITNSLVVNDATASSFIAVMNENNDLSVGISAMAIYNEKNEKKLIENLPNKVDTDYFVLETNFTEKTLQKIIAKYPDKKYIIDTVSGVKSLRIKSILSNIYILKTNLLEAEMISNIKVDKDEDLSELVKFFINKGVKKIFITLGEKGVVYGDKNRIEFQKSIKTKVVNTIGAGDSFVAGLVYGESKDLDIDQMANFGMKAASITVKCKNAVNPDLSENLLLS